MKKITFLSVLLCASVVANAAPTTAAPVPTWPAAQVMAVYSDSYELQANWGYLEGWGQATTLTTGDVDGNNYLSYANFNYLGWGCAASYNVMTMEKLHLDIWADEAGDLGIVPIYGGAGLTTDDSHRKIVTLEANKWNSIDLDLATDFEGLNLSSIFQFKYDNGTITSFALDNVFFYRTTALEDDEAPKDLQAEVVDEDFFSVAIKVSATDNMGVVNYVVLLDAAEVGNGAAESGKDATITIKNLEPGQSYSFSVVAKDAVGNEATPVTVNATTKAVPAAAPAPTLAAENVKALYSDAYTVVATINNYCEWWWQSPTVAQVTLGEGNNTLYYVSNLDGVFGWAFASTDFTGFQKIHLSVYPTSAFTFEIYPVVTGEPHKISETLTANEWNDVVFDYTELEAFTMKQLGFANRANTSFFLDNVYFFNEDDHTSIDNVNANVKVQKEVVDGVLYIIRDGVRYTVTGQAIR
ncbi:MAG: fibronectin type III domain-containing protein [Paludibacteraceae bacterium]|nr:fibronectin type III domain-containing protein [Paludibacteraceae bacterium]